MVKRICERCRSIEHCSIASQAGTFTITVKDASIAGFVLGLGRVISTPTWRGFTVGRIMLVGVYPQGPPKGEKEFLMNAALQGF